MAVPRQPHSAGRTKLTIKPGLSDRSPARPAGLFFESTAMLIKRIAFVILGVSALAVLWLVFQPAAQPPLDEKAKGVDGPIAMTAPSATPPAASERVIELVVKEGKLVSGPAIAQVRRGERVVLHIQSDAKDEVHLHGYDLRVATAPGAIARLQFTADRTGRFGLELHQAHRELGALEVYPQ